MKAIMKSILRLLPGVLALLSAISCGGNRKPLLPNVSGKAGEVIVVMEKSDWESALGNKVREVLACDCPWLAQKEPLYSLVNITPSNFGDLFKVHRNILFFDIDKQSQKTGAFLRQDMWSHPQCVIKLSATDSADALRIFSSNEEVILNALEQAERDRIVTNTLLYENRPVFDAVSERLGGSPHFPSGYKLKKVTDDFAWVSYDTQQSVIQGVFVYKYPVAEGGEFTKEKIVERAVDVLRDNVPGMFDGTYMTVVDRVLKDSFHVTPTVKFLKYKGRDFAEMRGFWEVTDDFMGGPFVQHSFYSPDGSEIVVAMAFVYAPKYNKRQYLRQVESMLYSFEWRKAGAEGETEPAAEDAA